MSTPRLLKAAAASISTLALLSGLWVTAAAGSPALTTTTSTTPLPTTTLPTTTLPTTTASTTPTTTPAPTTSTSTTAVPAPTTTTTSSGAAAEGVLASSISAANSQSALTWTLTETAGVQSLLEVGHAGRVNGTELITAHLGNQVWQVSLVLIGPRIYVLANAAALVQIVGLEAAAAKSEADTWFYVPSSDTYLYHMLSDGLTVSSATGAENLVGTVTVLPGRTVLGQHVVGLRQVSSEGIITAMETVYIRTSGTPLPVEVQNSYPGMSEAVTFSDWGQAPLADAPNGAIPFEKSWLLKPLPKF